MSAKKRGWYRRWGKRALDVAGSVMMLVALAPLLALVALAVRCALGRPVLFRQQRPGLNGGPFILLKFRTMREVHDELGQLLPDGVRLTGLGQVLRVTSVDELPTLLNVLFGDMSLVGPRPLLIRYLERFTPEQARRHEVKPGITGWAQVKGRNALTWEEKFRLDVWYVDHCSLGLDVEILAMTAWKVVTREGISAGGHATMPEFMGSQKP